MNGEAGALSCREMYMEVTVIMWQFCPLSGCVYVVTPHANYCKPAKLAYNLDGEKGWKRSWNMNLDRR